MVPPDEGPVTSTVTVRSAPGATTPVPAAARESATGVEESSVAVVGAGVGTLVEGVGGGVVAAAPNGVANTAPAISALAAIAGATRISRRAGDVIGRGGRTRGTRIRRPILGGSAWEIGEPPGPGGARG
ncbi:hypothetical protein GCM10017602_08200 [Herbiconiux flava]|nr:hypothetical protein GCM10017602_08200 [Herbiconiux flava]